MLLHIHHDRPSEHRRLLVAGVVYLITLALLIGLAVAIYNKAFVRSTTVTVHADRAGLQLPEFGDVRMHGVIIGQVRNISQDGGEAIIQLALDPDSARAVPTDSRVAIKPTTLFGQKYVEFIPPAGGGPAGLSDGSVIPASRVQTSVELEAVLAKLSDLLGVVRPQDVSVALSAVAAALEGNGERYGQTLAKLEKYLATMNVHLPTLTEDIDRFADVARDYAIAAPDLVKLLKNATVTARTVSAKRQQLNGLFVNVTGLANATTSLLTEHEEGLAIEAKLAVPLFKMLALYAPQYPCLLEGLDKSTDALNQIFRNSRVYQTMVFSGVQRPPFGRIDRPEYGAIGHGPWCLGLPDNPIVGREAIKDGTEDNPLQHLGQGYPEQ